MNINGLQTLIPRGFSIIPEGRSLLVIREGWEKVLGPLGGKSREEMIAASPGAEFLRGRGRPLVLET
ncbi:MAG: hypothetical protein NTV79_05400, partial [Candidatus Aureabacteria bacterium]|nr:hypothetical protein [Candidatus Auribacterota bacterium]